MNTVKELIKKTMMFFAIITTGSTFGAALSISIVYPGQEKILSVKILWQILILSFLVALACLIFYSKKELNKKQYVIRVIIHYVVTNIILVGGGKLFGWLDMDKNENVLGFISLVLVIYIVILTITMKRDLKDSQEMNEALRHYHLRQKE